MRDPPLLESWTTIDSRSAKLACGNYRGRCCAFSIISYIETHMAFSASCFAFAPWSRHWYSLMNSTLAMSCEVGSNAFDLSFHPASWYLLQQEGGIKPLSHQTNESSNQRAHANTTSGSWLQTRERCLMGGTHLRQYITHNGI